MWRKKPGESEAEFRDRKRRMAAAMAYKEKRMAKEPSPVEYALFDKTNRRWYVMCASKSCNKKVSTSFSTGANMLVAKFKNKSWKHIKGQKWICPSCQSTKQCATSTGGDLDMDRVVRLQEKHEVSTAKAKAAKRQAIALLEDEFDVDTGTYKDGSSDKTIAELVELSESAIANLRSDLFGDIREKTEIEKLRDDMFKLLDRLDKLEKQS